MGLPPELVMQKYLLRLKRFVKTIIKPLIVMLFPPAWPFFNSIPISVVIITAGCLPLLYLLFGFVTVGEGAWISLMYGIPISVALVIIGIDLIGDWISSQK